MNNNMKKVKNYFASLAYTLEHSTSDAVQKIKNYLEALLPFALELSNYSLAPSCKEHLINLAVSRYIWGCLSTSEHLRKNLHAFSKSGYLFCSKEENKDFANYQNIYRSFNKVQKMLQGQQEVAYWENRAISKEWELPDASYSRTLPIDILWMTDMYNKGHTYIFQLFCNRKRLLGSTAEKYNNGTLAAAYNSYFSMFERISSASNPITHEVPSSQLEDLEFIIHCMMLHDMEYSSRFLFAAALSQYMKKNSIPPDFRKYRGKLSLLCSRIAEMDKSIDFPTDDSLLLPFTSYDIIPPGFDFKYIFDNSPSSDQYFLSLSNNIKYIHELLELAVSIYRPSFLRINTASDYKAIRKFYEQDFPIDYAYNNLFQKKYNKSGSFDGIDLGETYSTAHDTCYDYIRSFYEFLLEGESEYAYTQEITPRKAISAKWKGPSNYSK